MDLPHWDGWHLIGAFPDGEPDDVGSWLLSHNREAMLLEVPPGLTVRAVRRALRQVGAELRIITASHGHEDHLDRDAWEDLTRAFSGASFIDPERLSGRADTALRIGGEPAWLSRAPKHSSSDQVTVFRGVAMTGDIELGTLESVNDEVTAAEKKLGMDWLRGFPARHNYHVHSVVSAHLNDVRTGINWPDLFEV